MFSYNRLGSSFRNTYVLTDMIPDENICNKIIQEFQEMVRASLKRRAIEPRPVDTESNRSRPLEWLKQIVRRSDSLRDELISEIVPLIHHSTSIEFARLFTNFSLICGKEDYEETLRKIFRRPIRRLFFYYSGHGIRLFGHPNSTQNLNLVIPGKFGQTEYYSRVRIQKCFQELLTGVDMVVLFDCCYSENLLELPFRLGFRPNENLGRTPGVRAISGTRAICLAGARSDQTCGFYSDGNESCSLYTYYLLGYLNSIGEEIKLGIDNRELSRLFSGVETKVQEYRLRTGKRPQNMLIGLSNSHIDRFPKWLFSNSYRRGV